MVSTAHRDPQVSVRHTCRVATELNERIRFARTEAGLSQQALADAAGVSRPAVSQWESGGGVDRENLLAVCRATGAPVQWMMSNDSKLDRTWDIPLRIPSLMQPAVSDEQAAYLVPYFEPRSQSDAYARIAALADDDGDSVELEPEVAELVRFARGVRREFVFVPLYSVEAAAGHGAEVDVEDVVSYMAFRRHWIVETMQMDPERCGLITARGHSMSPDIRDGELLLVDLRRNAITEPGTYVLRFGKDLVVKNAERAWDGTVHISSRSEAFPPQTIPAGRAHDLHVVGLVRSQQRRL